MEYIVFISAIFGLIVLLMLKGFYDEQKRRKRFTRWLEENYGVLPEREAYKTEEMEKISKYYRVHETDEFQIDDITWNDLNMDRVFQKMNYTYSAAGEEYLYYMLRTAVQSEDELQRLERHIQYFAGHKEERVRCQLLFVQIGKTGKYSIYDYLKYLDSLGERSNFKHHLGNLMLFASLISMYVSVKLGIVLLVVVICRNIISYFKEKKEIDPYITSFLYIFRLMENVGEMEKIPAAAFKEELEELSRERKKLTRFKAGSYILMSSAAGGSGNPFESIFDYIRMIFHLDLMKFNRMLSEVRKHQDAIDRMVTIMGYMEATIAIGHYRAAKETWCLPQFDRKGRIEASKLYHPLVAEPVKNSIAARKGVLLTGSNASGKSTFLKTVAVNAILAQTIHTCLADSYHGDLFRIMSSMSLRDDLTGGDSYYIVEIKSLKRILNEAGREGNPVLGFVDEVLRGTNTIERIAASAQILKSLSGSGVCCFAATHDIELTHLLEGYYDNYHFEEEISNEDIVFNYQLKPGRATTRNAIKLLGIMGYDKGIIKEAEQMAENFIKNGTWTSSAGKGEKWI